MNNGRRRFPKTYSWLIIGLVMLFPLGVGAQSFDFARIESEVNQFSVIIDMEIDVSFGVHSNQQSDRFLGTIVSEDGLVIFDGSGLDRDRAMSSLSGMNVRTTPTRIRATTMTGKTYPAEYIGVDRFTHIGFMRLSGGENERFTPVRFAERQDFQVGEWIALYMLLPEYIRPPLAADIGMVSAQIVEPERFPLIVGFSPLQAVSVLFDSQARAVGVLGELEDPSTDADLRGMVEGAAMGIPMMGIVGAERLNALIADPPTKGKVDRGWLGITLQALTEELAGFWGLDITGGIVVNDVVKESPAQQAGLEVGDVIYEVNGQSVGVDREDRLPLFQRNIADMGPNTSVEFSVLRRSSDESFDSLRILATLAAAPLEATDAPEYESKSLEFTVRDIVFADYLFYNMDPESLQGAVVSELKPGGLASVEGLQLGDVIQRIGEQTIAGIDDVQLVIEELELSRPAEVIFFVWRNNKTLFVNIKTDWN